MTNTHTYRKKIHSTVIIYRIEYDPYGHCCCGKDNEKEVGCRTENNWCLFARFMCVYVILRKISVTLRMWMWRRIRATQCNFDEIYSIHRIKMLRKKESKMRREKKIIDGNNLEKGINDIKRQKRESFDFLNHSFCVCVWMIY